MGEISIDLKTFARDATYLDMSFFPKALKIFEAIKALNTYQIFDDTKEI